MTSTITEVETTVYLPKNTNILLILTLAKVYQVTKTYFNSTCVGTSFHNLPRFNPCPLRIHIPTPVSTGPPVPPLGFDNGYLPAPFGNTFIVIVPWTLLVWGKWKSTNQKSKTQVWASLPSQYKSKMKASKNVNKLTQMNPILIPSYNTLIFQLNPLMKVIACISIIFLLWE